MSDLDRFSNIANLAPTVFTECIYDSVLLGHKMEKNKHMTIEQTIDFS